MALAFLVLASLGATIFLAAGSSHLPWSPRGSDSPAVHVSPELVEGSGNLSVVLDTTTPSVDLGETITLSAQVSGGTLPYTCKWSSSDELTKVGSCTGWSFVSNATGTVAIGLSATDALGKRGQATPLSITVASPLSLDLGPGPLQGDAGIRLRIPSTVANGTGTATCSWWLDQQLVASATSCIAFELTVNSGGQHTLQGTATDSATPPASARATLLLDIRPALTVVLAPSDPHPTLRELITISATVSGGSPPTDVEWSINGTPEVGTALTFQFETDHAGTYAFTASITDAVGGSVSSPPLAIQVGGTPSATTSPPPSNSLPPAPGLLLGPLAIVALAGVAVALFLGARRLRGERLSTSQGRAGAPPPPSGVSPGPRSLLGPTVPPAALASPPPPPPPAVPPPPPPSTSAPVAPRTVAVHPTRAPTSKVSRPIPPASKDRPPKVEPTIASRAPTPQSFPRVEADSLAPKTASGSLAGTPPSPATTSTSAGAPRRPGLLSQGKVGPVPSAEPSKVGPRSPSLEVPPKPRPEPGRPGSGRPSRARTSTEVKVRELSSIAPAPSGRPDPAPPVASLPEASQLPTTPPRRLSRIPAPDLPSESLVGQACPWVPIHPIEGRSVSVLTTATEAEDSSGSSVDAPLDPPSSSSEPSLEPPGPIPPPARCPKCHEILPIGRARHDCPPAAELESILRELAQDPLHDDRTARPLH
ncbi:MAG: hypothetical protein KGJ23_11900 [Euryarchaeota archaeon]|nr:hypothetical protein [Euryarchaeota archaeon]MDE2045270.1 hypothetical protein [Thermoplasmata archaeon]